MKICQFVDDQLVIGPQHRCPLIPLRERSEKAGFEVRQVLAEVRSRYGNGSWLPTCRMTLPDGSRPRAYAGFALKDLPIRRPPFVDLIWPHLPFKGPLSDFRIPVTAQQLAGACKSGRVVMVRRGKEIEIARDCDQDYQKLLTEAKVRRHERSVRKDILRQWQPKSKSKPPLVAKIWPHLPFKGAVSSFPLPLSKQQLAGACKSARVAMIGRGSDILMARTCDDNFDDVYDLGKDRRSWGACGCNDREERTHLWEQYLSEFPHPETLV